jgi:hypothetical protein
MSKLKFGPMSMREFVDRLNLGSRADAQGRSFLIEGPLHTRRQNDEVLRYLQRGVFAMLWERATGGVEPRRTRTYGSLALLELAFFSAGKTKAVLVKTLVREPVLGTLRAPQSHQDDIRFIITTDGKDVFLVLSNEAIDARLSTLHKYDEGVKFEPMQSTLLQFALNKDFAMETAEETASV